MRKTKLHYCHKSTTIILQENEDKTRVKTV
jgi:hypothetical protein